MTIETGPLSRQKDLEHIAIIKPAITPAVQKAFQEQGRGALGIDITPEGLSAGENSYAYIPKEYVQAILGNPTLKLVQKYQPDQEMVIAFYKGIQVDSYQIPLSHQP